MAKNQIIIMTVCISLGVIILFKLFIWSLTLISVMYQEKYLFLLDFQLDVLHLKKICRDDFLDFLGVCLFISYFVNFYIFFYLWISLAKDLSILLISPESTFVLILCIFCLFILFYWFYWFQPWDIAIYYSWVWFFFLF